MNRERTIYHIDCNSFYASVECLDHPEWKQVPMAVAGDPQNRSGIILAKNELARRYDVKTTETIYQARRKCPDLLLVPPRMQRYMQMSRQIKRLFLDYTDQVESFGADEAWLDVSGSLDYFGMGSVELADQIRRRVRDEIGITVSVGVSFNKVFAKLASDLKKPDATTLISRETFPDRVWPLPAKELLFVGRNAAERLSRHGIQTIGDIARCQRETLRQLLGREGELLWAYANGMDDTPVRRFDQREPLKSIGNGHTFRWDLTGWDQLRAGVVQLTDEVAARLRANGVKCRCVQVTVKDSLFHTICRQKQLTRPTCLQQDLAQAAMALLYANWRPDAPVRALTVTAQQLTPREAVQEQLCLWSLDTELDDRYDRLETTIDRIRGRYGTGCIRRGVPPVSGKAGPRTGLVAESGAE